PLRSRGRCDQHRGAVSHERVLRQRLRVLGTLHAAVRAPRSLSAPPHRAALPRRPAAAAPPPPRAYRAEVETTLAVLPRLLPPHGQEDGPPAVVVIAADLGLCGDYAAQLAAEAVAARAALGAGLLWCVGRRAVRPLRRAGLTPDRVWAGAAGT